LKDLISFKKLWKSKGYIEIFGINFENNELIPIEEFAMEVVKWRRSRRLEET